MTEGHPDKLCDAIADGVLDACLAEDPGARVACEVLATAGKITGGWGDHRQGIAGYPCHCQPGQSGRPDMRLDYEIEVAHP